MGYDYNNCIENYIEREYDTLIFHEVALEFKEIRCPECLAYARCTFQFFPECKFFTEAYKELIHIVYDTSEGELLKFKFMIIRYNQIKKLENKLEIL